MIQNEINDEDDEYFDSEVEPATSFLIESVSSPLPVSSANKQPVDLNESISTTTPMRTIKAIYAVQFINNKPKNLSLVSSLDCCRIFINQENAMKLCKQDPDNRRFKMFKSFREAYAFSYESSEIESGQAPSIGQVQASLAASLDGSNDGRILSPSLMKTESKTPTQDAEKLPFNGPRKIEINELKQLIEKKNLEAVRSKVHSNPRFLISSGDSPIIFQEAFRYNALHLCAKENSYEVGEFLLNILSSVSFIQKLYINEPIEQSKARVAHLLDLYLNMPEKGLNETPLHFACKFGSFEMAKLLLSYDICSKHPINKSGKTPEDLICSKVTNKQNYNQIKSLFEDCFYLPLYRDEDKGQVIIDKPCSKLVSALEEQIIDNPNYNLKTIQNKTPTLLNRSQHKLAAYATAIYDRLKSPARLRQSPVNLDILRSDDFKGYERIVRKITDEMNMPWSEYWWFLDSFCDFKKHDGLFKLEVYLEQKKLYNIIELQTHTVANMLKEKNIIISEDDQIIIQNKLNEFLELVENLKKELDLKENQLSLKYESFLKTIKGSATTLIQNQDKMDLQLEGLNNEELNQINEINKLLKKYMTIIVELSKLDKTTKCYFNLYKTSKTLLEQLNCQNLFEQFYLSNNFTTKNISKQTESNSFNNTSRQKSFSKERMRLERRIWSNGSSDEEDNYYLDIDQPLNESQEELCNMLADQSINDDNDDLNSLIANMTLNPDKHETKENISNGNGIVSKNTPFQKPMNDPYLFNNNQKFKLFMFGDTPSKLDRAVFLALQDIKIDLKYYPILYEWFSYMRSCDQNEMSGWKSPMKKTPLKNLSIYLN